MIPVFVNLTSHYGNVAVHAVLAAVSEFLQYLVQEGSSSLFSPKLKKQKNKANTLLQRLEDAQVSRLYPACIRLYPTQLVCSSVPHCKSTAWTSQACFNDL